MKIKYLAFVSGLSLGLASIASATTMSLAGGTGSTFGVFDATDTTLVANGSLIRTGYLSIAGDVTSFVEFGTGQVRSVGVGASAKTGRIAGSVTPTLAESADDVFNGKTIYLWVYSTPTTSTTAQQGIFVTNKVFPPNDTAGVGDDVTVISNTDIIGTLAAPGFSAPQIKAEAADTNSPTHFVLGVGTTVPEPTALSLAAVLGLAFFKRRK